MTAAMLAAPGSRERRVAEEALARARREQARELELRRWRPGYRSDADRAWEVAVRLALRQTLAERRQRAALEGSWVRAEEIAVVAVGRAEEHARSVGGRSSAAQLAAARSSLGRARALAAVGDLEGARAAAEEAVERSSRVEATWQEAHRRFHDPELLRLWGRWAAEVVGRSREEKLTVILVDKLRRRLEVFDRGELVLSLPAELGARGLERKVRAGDRATPEGHYRVSEVRDRGATRFYRALMLDYPNREDREFFHRAQRRGEIPRGGGIGGLIEIHGEGGRGSDWTDGCVAVSNEDMDSLFRHVRVNTPVTIVGTVP